MKAFSSQPSSQLSFALLEIETPIADLWDRMSTKHITAIGFLVNAHALESFNRGTCHEIDQGSYPLGEPIRIATTIGCRYTFDISVQFKDSSNKLSRMYAVQTEIEVDKPDMYFGKYEFLKIKSQGDDSSLPKAVQVNGALLGKPLRVVEGKFLPTAKNSAISMNGDRAANFVNSSDQSELRVQLNGSTPNAGCLPTGLNLNTSKTFEELTLKGKLVKVVLKSMSCSRTDEGELASEAEYVLRIDEQ
ncbi:MAG: hypothetical protein NTV34_04650 [Proteobacteria bacterium]|nr:hypothetical protein [Pseudomonadota bacterium]